MKLLIMQFIISALTSLFLTDTIIIILSFFLIINMLRNSSDLKPQPKFVPLG
jgi:hypothetical protein